MAPVSRAALAAAALALAGCVTPVVYGPIGAESAFGYSDQRNADGSYTIRVVAQNTAQAHEFWDRRAGELCGGGDFRKVIYRAHIPVVTTTGYAAGPNGYGASYVQDVYGAPILEGFARCDGAGDTPTVEPEASAPTEETPAPTQP